MQILLLTKDVCIEGLHSLQVVPVGDDSVDKHNMANHKGKSVKRNQIEEAILNENVLSFFHVSQWWSLDHLLQSLNPSLHVP